MRKFCFFILIILLSFSPAFAKNNANINAQINQEFTTENMPEEVEFKALKIKKNLENIDIPLKSVLTTEVLDAQRERRWHKSGFIVCKLKYYVNDDSEDIIDVSDKNIYFIVRKYEKINGKEVAITGTEVVLSQAASIFIPGVDILYYFTKGAIQRQKHPNWFKAGVHNAYDNSIFWFWLKGKPIELDEDETVIMKEIKEKKAYKLKKQIVKRKERKKDKNKIS